MAVKEGIFMTYLEIIVNNCLYLLCPIALYLLFMIYKKNLDQEYSTLTLEITIMSSLYFLLRYGLPLHHRYPTMLFDIPLLLCYLKKKTGFGILISIILIFYQALFLHIHPLFLMVEYTIYFLGYLYVSKKTVTPNQMINYFMIVKSFILSVEVFLFINPNGSFQENITYLLTIICILYLVANLILYFFDQGEKIVDLHANMYKIEKEKELRTSLFKVTHEIKNPIAVCKGYLDMIDLNDKKKVNRYIPIIKSEIDRTLTLMDDFLDYTKIKIQTYEIDMVMLLEEIEASLQSLFVEKGVQAIFYLPEDEIYLEADFNRLKQVIINLLKNAIEAKDETKESSEIVVGLTKTEDNLQISIQDNGVGMNEEELTHVSDMFFTTKTKGSGLGVSLSKEIIELHHGKLEYFSKKGEGTEVRLTLPLTLDVA